MKKLTILAASVAMMLGIALAPMPTYAALTKTCSDVKGTALAACGACVAEEGSEWEMNDNTCKRANGGADLNDIVHTVINVMLFVIGVLAVIMIIFAGFRYVTSSGDKTKLDSAKSTIIYAVVGLIVAIIAFAIVQWVFSSITG